MTPSSTFLMRRFSLFAAVVASLCLGHQQGIANQAERPPNVVLIISDDQSWTDYGFMGHEVIKTPHLDRLARESLTFTRGYVPTALCRPSLATMITGLYPHQHKISGNDPALLVGEDGKLDGRSPGYQALRQQLISHIDRHETLPRLLASKGYKSFQSGKWWEGRYDRGGFTHGMTHGDPARGGRHGDEGLAIGRKGLRPLFDFIEQCQDSPFFVWYAPFLPHTPHNPPERFLAKYRYGDRPIELARYYAMCEWFDETCGHLLEYLDRKQLAQDTLVVYVTDNGWIQRTPSVAVPPGWRPSFAPRSKQSPYEGGTRTPIMLRWPGVVNPRMETQSLASSIDLMPTILEACGIEVPSRLPGLSLLGDRSDQRLRKRSLFGEGFAHDIADIDDPAKSLLYRWCIQDNWKLLLTYDGQVGRYRAVHPRSFTEPQLFDLLGDPQETINKATEQPAIVKDLTAQLDSWWKLPPHVSQANRAASPSP